MLFQPKKLNLIIYRPYGWTILGCINQTQMLPMSVTNIFPIFLPIEMQSDPILNTNFFQQYKFHKPIYSREFSVIADLSARISQKPWIVLQSFLVTLQLVMLAFKCIQGCYDMINNFCNIPAKILRLCDRRSNGANTSKNLNCIMLIRLGQTQLFSKNLTSDIQQGGSNMDRAKTLTTPKLSGPKSQLVFFVQ